MAKYLKTGLPSVESDAANVKVQETVAKIIADVRQRGDAAVREKLLVPFRALLAKARAEGIRDSKRDRRPRR